MGEKGGELWVKAEEAEGGREGEEGGIRLEEECEENSCRKIF